MQTPRDRPQSELLREFLADRDEQCPSCGYNLRNLHHDRCPECAQELILRVNLREPRLGGYVAGVAALAAGAGFSGLLILYIMLTVLFRGRWGGGPPIGFVAVTGGGFLIESIALAFWLSRGREIRRLESPKRIALVAGCFALTIANLVVFTLSVN